MAAESHPEIAVYVLTHGPSCEWLADYCIPLEIGAACRTTHCCSTRDNTGDNISEKDNLYCELTGLYWMWKNSPAEITGLYHYRRYYNLTAKKIQKYLKKTDFIVSKPDSCSYPDVEKRYCRDHIPEDWEIMKTVLKEQQPEYAETAEDYFKTDWFYGRNMFVTTKEHLDRYCRWLFPLLFEIEKRINLEDGRTNNNRRAMGYMSERLFTLYVFHNQKYNGLRVKQTRVWNVPNKNNRRIFSPACPEIIKTIALSNKYCYQFALTAQEYLYRKKLILLEKEQNTNKKTPVGEKYPRK